MTAYLLDTHVVIWLATDPEQIPRRLRTELTTAQSLWVSAASGYEIALKARLGRLPHGRQVLARWEHLLTAMHATDLPLSTRQMTAAGELDWDHRDPFDRMLVAQAQQEGLVLVTKDDRIRSFPEVSCAHWT